VRFNRSLTPNEKPGGSIPWRGERTGFNSRLFNVNIYNEIHPTSHHLIATAAQKGKPGLAVPVTPAGKYIHRRFSVCPAIADLVASLAGLGPDRRAA
jgi:hypothetical protein